MHPPAPPCVRACIEAEVGYESLNSGQACACKRSFSLNWFGMCKQGFRESNITCMASWPDYFNNGIVWHYF